MTRILIAADMEGITGVTHWDQVTPGQAEYARFREVMTEEVNAAARGAFEGGADEVIAVDGHWNGSNILIERLDARVRLHSGSPSPLSMMQGLDGTIGGVLFVGYHARQGSPNAICDHTWSSTCVANLWLNDSPAGEYTLNGALAGYFGVPVLMISGDQTACAQAAGQLGALETAIVKYASGRYAAECLPPRVSESLIREAAQRAVGRLLRKEAPAPFVIPTPVKVTVEWFTSDMADRAMLMLGVRRDGLKVSLIAADMPGAYSAFRSLVTLANPR